MTEMQPLPEAIKTDLEAANSHLLYLLDLLTPMKGQSRTGCEQVYFEMILAAASKLPVSNEAELSKYR